MPMLQENIAETMGNNAAALGPDSWLASLVHLDRNSIKNKVLDQVNFMDRSEISDTMDSVNGVDTDCY